MNDTGDQGRAEPAEAAHRNMTARLHRRAARLARLTGWSVHVQEPPRDQIQLSYTAADLADRLRQALPSGPENGDPRAPIRAGKQVVLTCLDSLTGPASSGTFPVDDLAALIRASSRPPLSMQVVTGPWFDGIRTGEEFSQQADRAILVVTDRHPAALMAYADSRELAPDMPPYVVPPSLHAAIRGLRIGEGRREGQQRGERFPGAGASPASQSSATRGGSTRRARLTARHSPSPRAGHTPEQ